ncbi:hypothetical protein [uncultured Duncaniella sp.]|uniref:hypothetical protein n=1 Tax=uncultured Duncaniella sp. TaxID=2768039 RepID=UPI00262A11CB|nr:hypothetical protein [uncultured Duncaniella sp.]
MIHDKASVFDLAIVNDVEYGTSGPNIIGDVEVLYNSQRDGHPIFTRSKHKNDLLVTGSVFFSEKVNNMRSKFQTLPLDVELGCHTMGQVIRDHSTIPHERICGLMIGNGGAGDTYNTVYKVNRTARSVPSPIPFRVVPVLDDLNPTDRAKYFLRVVKGDYAYYYGKKWDIEREIIVEFEDGTTVPIDVDMVPTSKFVKIYALYRVTIDQRDVREGFKLEQGSTLRSLVNSIGLVGGYPGTEPSDGTEEFFNVRGITTVNMENKELKDSASTITIIYKEFIQ